jgi:general secretion pathway protein D
MNKKKKLSGAKIRGILPFCIVCLSLGACRVASEHSREVLDRHHMQTLKSAPEKSQPPPKIFYKKKKKPSPPIPFVMKKRVSVTITEEVPLKDAFIELARQAEVDLQLDPKIVERVVFVASKRPFVEVIKDICDMAYGIKFLGNRFG